MKLFLPDAFKTLSFPSSSLIIRCLRKGLFGFNCYMEFVKIPGFADPCISSNFRNFWSLFQQISCVLSSLSSSRRTLIKCVLVLLLTSHRSIRFCSLFSFFPFFLLWVNNFKWPVFMFADFFLLPVSVCCRTPVVSFSIQLRYFSASELVWFFFILYKSLLNSPFIHILFSRVFFKSSMFLLIFLRFFYLHLKVGY